MANRDIRVLDASFRSLPSILVRKNAILVNFDYQRALISNNKLILFSPFGPNTQSIILAFKDHMKTIRRERFPHEFVALEYILITVCDTLERRYSVFEQSIDLALDKARKSQGITLNELLPIKERLSSFEIFLKETANAISEIIDSDEDMAEMYLTVKASTGHRRRLEDHQEIEVLLESYLHKIEELQNEVKGLTHNILSTEQLIQIHLDTTRNQIMRLELLLSMGTFSMAAGAFGASIFGMNLLSHFETHPYAFYFVSGSIGMITIAIIWYAIRFARYRHIDLFPNKDLTAPYKAKTKYKSTPFI